MAIENDLLVKCLDISKYIVNNNLMTTMSIKIGNEFYFDFNNSNQIQKRLSPSQRRRNFDRQEHFIDAKNKKNDEDVDVAVQKAHKLIDAAVQTDIKKELLETKTTQTDLKKEHLESKTTQTDVKKEHLESKENQTILFKRIDAKIHDVNSIEDNRKNNGDIKTDDTDVETQVELSKTTFGTKSIQPLNSSYKCYLCAQISRTKSELIKHHNFMHKDKSVRYTCERCDENWPHEVMLNSHKQMEHNIHVCARCNTQYAGKDNLDEHIRIKHRAF